MRNPSIAQIITSTQIVTLTQIITLFWPHENVTIMSSDSIHFKQIEQLFDLFKNGHPSNIP